MWKFYLMVTALHLAQRMFRIYRIYWNTLKSERQKAFMLCLRFENRIWLKSPENTISYQCISGQRIKWRLPFKAIERECQSFRNVWQYLRYRWYLNIILIMLTKLMFTIITIVNALIFNLSQHLLFRDIYQHYNELLSIGRSGHNQTFNIFKNSSELSPTSTESKSTSFLKINLWSMRVVMIMVLNNIWLCSSLISSGMMPN